MHIFNVSVTYMQNVGTIQWKLKEKLISQRVHYQQ